MQPDAPAEPVTASSQGSARPGDRAADTTGALASAVRVVSGLTLVSRFSGLARDVVTARIFGDSALGSAFRAAYAAPNLFRRLFGEGALSAAFIPQYTTIQRDDPAMAAKLANLVIAALTLGSGLITLLIEIVLGLRLWLLPADADTATSIRLIMLMLPMMPAVCITAILGGVLQVHGRFAVPAAAPIILNLFQIAAGLAFYIGLTGDELTTAYIIGGAALLASVAQVVWSILALRGVLKWSAAFRDAVPAGRTVLSKFVPVLLGLGTLQLNTMMDTVIAMWPLWVGPTMFGRPVPLDASSNAIISYTQTLYQFPLGVFGIAVATAVFPLLARTANDAGAFTDTLRRGLRLSLFIGLPASVGLFLVREDLLAVIFGGGREAFSADGLERAQMVLAGFSIAVWAYSLNHVFTRAFYAQGDTKTPMRIAMSMVALNIGLNFTLIWPLREAGLAWSTAATAMLQTVILLILCRRRLRVQPFGGVTAGAFARIAAVTGVMGAGVIGVLILLPAAESWSMHLVRLAAAVGAGGIIYLAAAVVLKLPELRWLMTRAPRGPGGSGGPGAASIPLD